MTTLYLLRHAHAGNPDGWSGDDDLRPLSEKGRRQASRLGEVLARWCEAPDLLITSPRVRARETAVLVAGGLHVEVVEDPRLARSFDAAQAAEIAAEIAAAHGAARPCLVGHDPDLSSVLGELIGLAEVPMRKGALARVDFDDGIHAASGTIRLLLPPEPLTGK
jgi:phosphohistidine phosphatase SixA